MSESFLAAFKVVVPMMLLMILGWTTRVTGLITRPAMKEFDRILFRVFVPSLLFKNIYEMDFSKGFALREMIFAAVCLSLLFVFSIKFPRLLTSDPKKSSVIGQAVVRSNYILFGVAVSEALYGEGNVEAVILLGVLVVPAINIFSAVILELGRNGKAKFGELLMAVLKNPMIIAAAFGFALNFGGVKFPDPVWSVVRSIANSATTLSFLSLGVGLDMAEIRNDRKLLLWGIFLRMIAVPVIFMSLSIIFGFRFQSLCAMMIVFAAPTAVSSYPMAVAMGADGQLAGQFVCTTTILSLLTIFLWTVFLKSFGLM